MTHICSEQFCSVWGLQFACIQDTVVIQLCY
jgi:hypothetical protein